MTRSIHHTTVDSKSGCCLICGKHFLMYWYDKEEMNGRGDTCSEVKGGLVHFECGGGKSLQQLNEERKAAASNSRKIKT